MLFDSCLSRSQLHAEELIPSGDCVLSPSSVGGMASHATDEGEEQGVHFSKKLKRMTMPSAARAETVYVAPAHEHAETLDLKTMALPKADGGVPYAGPASVPQVRGKTVYVAPAHKHAETLDLKTMALPKARGGVPYAGPASVPQARGAEGAKATNVTKSAAAAARAADREKRGVEPKFRGNEEERAAYMADYNAAFKQKAEAEAASLFAPLPSEGGARSTECTKLLAAIKEELEHPPGKNSERVYTRYETMRHFLMAQGKPGGNSLANTRAKFVSLLGEKYDVSIDDSKDRKRPDVPSDDAPAPKPKKQKK